MSASRIPTRAAELREGDREVRGEGRLADAALAARDGDHARVAVEADHLSRSVAPPRSFVVSACRSSGVMTPKASATPRTPGTPASACSTCCSNESRSGQPAMVRAIVTETIAVVDLDVAHHVQLGDRALELRVDDLLERLEDGVRGLPASGPAP